MREKAERVPATDIEAILAAASVGALRAVKVARERLGWSVKDAVSLVHVLRNRTELGAPADDGAGKG